ncbi:hypothetical protein [Microbispora sp. GKU 823]|uniref:hypothetical protein n=1 Tax=Microbispora sp. GKU 823 TaxID=1652100 RepID=UPI0009A42AFC|nr:hypothetical protein [Microbispora sp. GKU 823]OPG13435.1 hypothetical protein B1L11_08115 [Microbispora sp. GKU 823]
MASRLRELRRACEARARQLPLPSPFDVRRLCAVVAEQRGRPIHLRPLTGGAGVYGLWVATEVADLIFYEQATTTPHQEHIILHELCHILCDHYPAPDSAAEDTRWLLPDLDPEMVRRVLERAGYSAVEEQEAELLASLIWQRARAEPMTPRRGGTISDRLQAALEWSEGPQARRRDSA